ncbi:UDP-N-acetylglucosamine diphosphorylase/glucosamine-1-phosphate N-acetyltransferase [Proteobacteria bacterium 005FR1]|nr:UDP-N-acetylglucosamine diphosphorylase/glucosamine-1-phosphate N-acetyltransferase [Proteobacteria bacterium 005FR1]
MLNVVVLAAGKGTRMKSNLPKVLHPIAGRPLLQHVLDTSRQLNHKGALNVVVGHGAEQIEAALTAEDVRFVLQAEQLGTGHAVQQALPYVDNDETVLVLYGDVPLIKAATVAKLSECVSATSLGLLTLNLNDPNGYGRIVRNTDGDVTAIVEQKDANDEQKAIGEVNTGILAVRGEHLHKWLPTLSNSNAQGEYYLTDIIALARADGVKIHTEQPQYEWEVLGINNRIQQAELERVYQLEQARRFMADGLSLSDPARFDCRGELEFGEDVQIDINCVFEGRVQLGNNVRIGPNCCLKDAVIGDNCVIKANTIVEDATLANNCEAGPFARLRPGTELANGAKVGNFVEVKKARLGEGSKANHLTYIGDAEIGKNVNIGAGTITCNYDGVNKSKTEIGDHAFIGSNTSLVAPVKVGKGATIGAGSTITSTVPDDQLAVARGKQRNIEGWQRPTKKK